MMIVIRNCLLFCSIACIFACNTTKENLASETLTKEEPTQSQIKPKVAESDKAATPKITYEDFKKMTPEQQWRTLSPARRNYLRKKPNLYPQYKKMVEAEPEMEQVAPK